MTDYALRNVIANAMFEAYRHDANGADADDILTALRETGYSVTLTPEVTTEQPDEWPGTIYRCGDIEVQHNPNGDKIFLPMDLHQAVIDGEDLDALIACLNALRDARQ